MSSDEHPAGLLVQWLLSAATEFSEALPGDSRIIIFAIHHDGDEASGTMGAVGYSIGAPITAESGHQRASIEGVSEVFSDALAMMSDAAEQCGMVLPFVPLGEPRQG